MAKASSVKGAFGWTEICPPGSIDPGESREYRMVQVLAPDSVPKSFLSMSPKSYVCGCARTSLEAEGVRCSSVFRRFAFDYEVRPGSNPIASS